MSEKSEETKSAPVEGEKKQEETGETQKDARGEPEESQEKHPETLEKAEETREKPPKAEKVPTEAGEKPEPVKEKSLEKMTVKDLREMAKDIPGITGVHGMKKDELLVQIKAAKGIEDEPAKKTDASISEIKQKIKVLKAERQAALEAKDKKKALIFKRRIARLKKKTRRAAA